MKIEQASIASAGMGRMPSGGEAIDRERRGLPLQSEPVQDEKKVAPEEVLKKIKSLTEEGAYSVRFEMDKDVDQLVIRLFDHQSGDMIRQFPSEELLEAIKSLRDFRGLLVNTQS